jgi:hypothetical protein
MRRETPMGSIISLEDQYEVAKARASIAFHTSLACMVVTHLPEYWDGRESAGSIVPQSEGGK